MIEPEQERNAAKPDPEVREHETAFEPGQGSGQPSVFACPECHGVLWEMKDGELVRYRCRVGHSYASGSLTRELDDASERALWAALRALEEKAAMSRRMAMSAKETNEWTTRLQRQAAADAENAEIVRKIIFEGS